MKILNVYVHIPFCLRKCHYCAFYSLPAQPIIQAHYLKRLIQDIRAFSHHSAYSCRTLYIGGGTPSLLPTSLVGEIVKAVKGKERALPKEVTLEANPESLNRSKFFEYRKMGINRLSLGLQAAQDRLLRLMGRRHTYENFVRVFKEARGEGIANINVDLIFGLPTQTLSEWDDTLQRVLALRPNHIAAYSLEVNNRSTWGKMVTCHTITPASDSVNRHMYSLACDRLRKSGYMHYEISNWALPGFRCLHNHDFWMGKPYRGFGTGAYSFDGTTFTHIKEDITAYITNESLEPIVESVGEEKKRWLWLRLRLITGVDKKAYLKTFGSTLEHDWGVTIKKLANQGFLRLTTKRLTITSSGRDVFDGVMKYLLSLS